MTQHCISVYVSSSCAILTSPQACPQPVLIIDWPDTWSIDLDIINEISLSIQVLPDLCLHLISIGGEYGGLKLPRSEIEKEINDTVINDYIKTTKLMYILDN